MRQLLRVLCLFLLGEVYLLATTATAGTPRAGWSKALVWPTAAGGYVSAAQLTAIGAERIRDYESFCLVRVPSSAVQTAAAQAVLLGLRFDNEDGWDKLLMPGWAIDTRSPVLPTNGLIERYTGGEGLFVLQFDGPGTAAMLAQIPANGLTYVEYVPYNGAVVFGKARDVLRLAASPDVQWVSVYHPAFRHRPAALPPAAEIHPLLVQLVSTPRSEHVVARLRALSRLPVDLNSYGPYLNVRLRASSSIIPELLSSSHVVGIEYPGAPRPSGEREAIAVTSLTPSSSEPWQDGDEPHKAAGDFRTWLENRGLLDTSAYRIAFADTGVAGYHQDITNGRDIGYLTYTDEVPPDSYDFYGHGTAVAGIAVGDSVPGSVDGDNFYWGMGLAPKTMVLSQRIFDTGFNRYGAARTWANDAYNWGCTVQNHSWNDYSPYEGPINEPGTYSTLSQEFDFSVRDTYGGEPFTQLPITASVGNICGGQPEDCTLMVLPPATAKNVLAVGASESWRLTEPSCARYPAEKSATSFRNVAGISRRGTADGRIKPDIIAPGTLASSAQEPDGANWCMEPNADYIADSGTSFSAPQAAAAYVLLSKKLNTVLTPAMLKAAIIGTSLSAKGGIERDPPPTVEPDAIVAARPNPVQGFGRLYLGDALATTGVTHTFLDEDSWPPFTGAGETRSRTFTVADGSKPTVIVLAWTDPPASAGASLALVRDLDMWIEWFPYYYTGNQMTDEEVSEQQTGTIVYDDRNNVEMIVIPPNTLSTFALRVTIRTFAGSPAWQSFALFASNAS